MGLFALFIITLLLWGLNYVITNGDFLAPSTLFCEMFFLYEMICLIGKSYYKIIIHAETIIVITCGLLIFTVFCAISNNRRRFKVGYSTSKFLELHYIAIPDIMIYILIGLQLGTVYFFVQYLHAISNAWGSGGSSLTEMISLYDTMTKFWTATFTKLNVSIPMFYRIFSPITSAAAYIVLYVAVNNFAVCKKIKKSHIIVILLLCILILLNGSRSPILRVVTMIISLLYVFYYKVHKRKNKGIKAFVKLVSLMLIVAGLMILALFMMGRAANLDNILGYVFTYLGAPIVNLDTFLNKSDIGAINGLSTLFGEHTFRGAYNYIGKIFDIESFTNISDINVFTFSTNGIEIGNVYTTFYPFIYDFGYIGILPLLSIPAVYYCFTYNKVLRMSERNVFNYKLFIFSYLFNDLVMLPFSNRFYETVLDAAFLKFLILSWVLVDLLFEHSVVLGKTRIRIRLIKQ